jgi:hypothetical protein
MELAYQQKHGQKSRTKGTIFFIGHIFHILHFLHPFLENKLKGRNVVQQLFN